MTTTTNCLTAPWSEVPPSIIGLSRRVTLSSKQQSYSKETQLQWWQSRPWSLLGNSSVEDFVVSKVIGLHFHDYITGYFHSICCREYICGFRRGLIKTGRKITITLQKALSVQPQNSIYTPARKAGISLKGESYVITFSFCKIQTCSLHNA